MWDSDATGYDGTDGSRGGGAGEEMLRRYCVAAAVNDDLIAAVEGWRRAHGLVAQPEALGELVRLGLMSEVAKIYQMVRRDQGAAPSRAETFRKHRRHHRSRRAERREHQLPAN